MMAPKQCVMKDSSKLPVLYAYDEGQCSEAIRNQKEKAEQSECQRWQETQSNVVSDKDAGRRSGLSDWHKNLMMREIKLRTMVKEDSQQICFSVRPVPKCIEGSKAKHSITKKISFHCEPKTPEVIEMKRRIEIGANPNFDETSASIEENMEIPIECRSL